MQLTHESAFSRLRAFLTQLQESFPPVLSGEPHRIELMRNEDFDDTDEEFAGNLPFDMVLILSKSNKLPSGRHHFLLQPHMFDNEPTDLVNAITAKLKIVEDDNTIIEHGNLPMPAHKKAAGRR